MTLYQRVDLPSETPIQFVGVYVLKWGEVLNPTVGFYEADPCEWKEAQREDCWDTGCGRTFMVLTGTPDENGMEFCPYCGCELRQAGEEV